MANKDIEIPFGAYDSELGGFEYTIPEGYKAEIKDGKVVVKKTESEDEKMMRKFLALIEWSKSYAASGITSDEAKEMTAWLEKQAEHAKFRDSIQVGDKVTRNRDGMLVNLSQLNRVAKKDEKVEPKFHEGDWVVRNGETLQISGIDTVIDGTFHYWFTKGTWLSSKKMENAMLWTIQDAKDGDVLATENFIFIFKNIDSGNGVHYYCHYEISKHEDDNQFGVALPQSLMGIVGNSLSHYFPATKEQRDTLERAMAEAGYTFDFKKKELKKIEQKPADTEKGAKGNDREIPNSEPPLTLKHAREVMGIKQDTAWSEEDEMFVHGLIRGLAAMKNIHGHTTFSSDNIDITKTIDWLKSLKERYTWNPSDEQIEAVKCAALDVAKFSQRSEQLRLENDSYYKALISLYEQLKKLREE